MSENQPPTSSGGAPRSDWTDDSAERTSFLRRPAGLVTAGAAGVAVIALAVWGVVAATGSASADPGTDTAADTSTSKASESSDLAALAEAPYDPIRYANGVPQRPLIPSDSTEAYGSTIVREVFDPLVRIGPDGELTYEVAKSIETEDSTTFTVTLNEDRTFSNGEQVTASSFVDAWNWTADLDNAVKGASYLESVAGYDEVHPSAEGATPTSDTLSGLTVKDDYTFTIELSEPWSSFPLTLSSTVLAPLPSVFYEDVEAFGSWPIGNGPYQVRSEFSEANGIELEVNPSYVGTRTPQNTGIHFLVYLDQDAAYQDLISGNVDYSSSFSSAALLTAEADLGDRFVSEPGSQNQTLVFPVTNEFWASENGFKLRQAISLAINRQEIVDVIFDGRAVPSRDFTQINLPGWQDDLPGSDILDYDPERAKALYAESGGYPDGTLQVHYNNDGNNKAWVEAVVNQLRNTLGIDAVATPSTTFAEFLDAQTQGTFTGPWRAGNVPAYPSLEDLLVKVYSRGNNNSGWSNAEFDTLLAQAAAAASPADANPIFQQAQEILLQELPAIPLWYQYSNYGFSDRVENVVRYQFGGVQTHLITVKES